MAWKECERKIDFDFRTQQHLLFQKFRRINVVEKKQISSIAGVDLAYWSEKGLEYAVCCIVVVDYLTGEIIEKKDSWGKITVPYVPGYLAFREMPLILETVQKLEYSPNLYMFDGNGYLHPRHMGIATHAGILLEKPSIGIAKSYYKIKNVNYEEPANEEFAVKEIVIENEVYGLVLRTHKGVKPIFVSVGNMIDLDTSVDIIKNLITKESRIPIPTRYADIETHKMRKIILNL